MIRLRGVSRPAVRSGSPSKRSFSMAVSIALAVILVASVLSDSPPPPQYQPASYDYPAVNPVYNFRYQVENDEHYEPQMFKQEENRDGYETHGEYSVLLPDGRTQIVTYQVNGDSGFIADVKFEGEAKYDAYPPKPQP
eukprot:maker-scaffold547_size140190-snap-gene-0.27 protein:Tk03232 transcript:maker-scaffold547_size140190-snap-gene-0.27-mRNA-1 annotation:"cuticle protein 7"